MPQDSSREIFKVESCRICQSKDLFTFLQLGPTPIPNGFLRKGQLNMPEKFYPLDVCFCQKCTMVQLAHVVSPEVMFKNYLYIPSTSSTMTDHFTNLAQTLIQESKLTPSDLVIDIGSNDGTLLKAFKSQGIKILGIDPAKNLALKANAQGIKTIAALFNKNIAKSLKSDYQKPKIITATNVIAHVDNLHDFFEGVSLLLEKDGLFVAEFPYFLDLLKKVQFDTIYQEHLSYLSLTPLTTLLNSHGFNLTSVLKIPVHGGSLRIFATKSKTFKKNSHIANLLAKEQTVGIKDIRTYLKFRSKVDKIRHNLVQLLWELRLKNKRVVGYGASAKGNIMLNYCRIGTETLDYIVDSIPYKQGKYTPGMHIPIFAESKLIADQPDYAILLAWNFKEEIIKKHNLYRNRGGKFIVTIPQLEII